MVIFTEEDVKRAVITGTAESNSAYCKFREAFEPIFNRYARLFSIDPEELGQEVTMKSLRPCGFDKYDPKRAKLTAYVKMLTRSVGIDMVRRRKSRISAKSLDESFMGESISENKPTQEGSGKRIESLIDILCTPNQTEIVRLHYLYGATLAVVADQLNIPLGTVKSRLSGFLKRARERLSDREAYYKLTSNQPTLA
ncbi:MAG: sigma-70 family RNA polymerase sigma factor [Nanoarchaeota archaeon]|nr:sigma-70 family RNA polymerase sigma factor [Nanoarchaeota archaeon]